MLKIDCPIFSHKPLTSPVPKSSPFQLHAPTHATQIYAQRDDIDTSEAFSIQYTYKICCTKKHEIYKTKAKIKKPSFVFWSYNNLALHRHVLKNTALCCTFMPTDSKEHYVAITLDKENWRVSSCDELRLPAALPQLEKINSLFFRIRPVEKFPLYISY